MQSSPRNSLAAALNADSHSPRPSRVGLSADGRCALAAEEREAANAYLFVVLASAPREVAHRRADAAGQDEAGDERTGHREREVGAQLGCHVRRLADLAAKLVECGGELPALLLDVVTNLGRRAS